MFIFIISMLFLPFSCYYWEWEALECVVAAGGSDCIFLDLMTAKNNLE